MKTSLSVSLLLLWIIVTAALPIRAQEATEPLTPYATNTPSSTREAPVLVEPSTTVRIPNETPVNAEASPIRITAFSYQKTSRQLLGVSIRVKNVSETPQSGLVWFLLAPPDSAEPWNEAVFVAPEQEITLRSGEERSLTFEGADDTIIPGDYRLSVWAHRLIDESGERVHSDGLGTPETIFIGPRFQFSIEYVDLVEDSDTTTLYVTFFVRNNTVDTSELELSYSVAAPNDPTPWETGVFNLPFKYLRLDPGDPTIVTYRNVVLLEPETEYQITGWLHQITDGIQTQIGVTVYPTTVKRES